MQNLVQKSQNNKEIKATSAKAKKMSKSKVQQQSSGSIQKGKEQQQFFGTFDGRTNASKPPTT